MREALEESKVKTVTFKNDFKGARNEQLATLEDGMTVASFKQAQDPIAKAHGYSMSFLLQRLLDKEYITVTEK